MEDWHPQVDEELAVVEEEAAFRVVRADDPEDWLVRFEKSPDFPPASGRRTWSASTTGACPNVPPGLLYLQA